MVGEEYESGLHARREMFRPRDDVDPSGQPLSRGGISQAALWAAEDRVNSELRPGATSTPLTGEVIVELRVRRF